VHMTMEVCMCMTTLRRQILQLLSRYSRLRRQVIRLIWTILMMYLLSHSMNIQMLFHALRKNFKDPKVFLSGGRDSYVNVWRFTDEGGEDEIIEYYYDIGSKAL